MSASCAVVVSALAVCVRFVAGLAAGREFEPVETAICFVGSFVAFLALLPILGWLDRRRRAREDVGPPRRLP